MSAVTRILSAIEQGDRNASEQLLPLVYDELRKLAASCMAQEKPGQTLQATALVHEAYVRLVKGAPPGAGWKNRGHFFAAAAEAMRRILVERARQRESQKYGAVTSEPNWTCMTSRRRPLDQTSTSLIWTRPLRSSSATSRTSPSSSNSAIPLVWVPPDPLSVARDFVRWHTGRL